MARLTVKVADGHAGHGHAALALEIQNPKIETRNNGRSCEVEYRNEDGDGVNFAAAEELSEFLDLERGD